MNSYTNVFLSVIAASTAIVAEAEAYAKRYMTLEQAQLSAFPGALFEKIEKEELLKKTSEVSDRARFYKAISSTGELLGYFVFDATVGKHLLIDYTVALTLEAKVFSVEILEYREDYGGKISEVGWRNQFVNKSCANPIKLKEDIKNISGGTLSSKHITEGVKQIACATAELIKSSS